MIRLPDGTGYPLFFDFPSHLWDDPTISGFWVAKTCSRHRTATGQKWFSYHGFPDHHVGRQQNLDPLRPPTHIWQGRRRDELTNDDQYDDTCEMVIGDETLHLKLLEVWHGAKHNKQMARFEAFNKEELCWFRGVKILSSSVARPAWLKALVGNEVHNVAKFHAGQNDSLCCAGICWGWVFFLWKPPFSGFSSQPCGWPEEGK